MRVEDRMREEVGVARVRSPKSDLRLRRERLGVKPAICAAVEDTQELAQLLSVDRFIEGDERAIALVPTVPEIEVAQYPRLPLQDLLAPRRLEIRRGRCRRTAPSPT